MDLEVLHDAALSQFLHEFLADRGLRKKIELDIAVSEHEFSRHAATLDELVVDLEDGAGLEVADHHHVAALLENLPKLFLALLDLQIAAAHVSEVLRNLAPTLYLDIDVALRQPDCRCQPEPMHRGIEIDDSVHAREDGKANYPDDVDRRLATPSHGASVPAPITTTQTETNSGSICSDVAAIAEEVISNARHTRTLISLQ